jgi:hypothetical protein
MPNPKELLLAVISVVLIFMFFSIESYKRWLDDRVLYANKQIKEQLVFMEKDERLAMRMGNSYIVSLNAAKYLKEHKLDKNAVILLPPKEYIRETGQDYGVPEPVVFYLFTGMRAKWANSPGADKCNYAILYQNGEMQLVIINDDNRDKILSLFRKYDIAL